MIVSKHAEPVFPLLDLLRLPGENEKRGGRVVELRGTSSQTMRYFRNNEDREQTSASAALLVPGPLSGSSRSASAAASSASAASLEETTGAGAGILEPIVLDSFDKRVFL